MPDPVEIVTGESAGRALGAVLVLVGALLLGAATFTPWYAIDTQHVSAMPPNFPHSFFDTAYYLGPPWSDHTVRHSCTAGVSCPGDASYSNDSRNSTGVVTEVVLALVYAAIALGLLAGAIGLVFRRDPGWGPAVIALSAATLVLGAAAPALYGASFQFGHYGPQSSFLGTAGNVNTLGRWTTSWGPASGWYLAIGAAAAVLAGVALLAYRWGDRAEPAPS